ncbi:nitroreductase family protein [Tissierella creatinophila]|uniref:FMN reductase n=1 Tax=Tissierella creatinophila DSM 6911 TaxID=1123403 RepID=A0A1U7M745_TISCR|nr:nitroreductase family protein [Tissierella creatinophila]OLS03143.1 FMN reductase [Tissierella creatinophila DSM 6911]
MNEVIKQIKERKSVRVFEDREIETHLKDEILNSAFQAPTAGGMMLYSILDITDKELKAKLSITCDNQPFIATAPIVLIFLADYQRWYDCFNLNGCNPRKPGEGDILLASSDALIAAQNTVVAAESLGLGSCYIGDILENCEVVSELLNLPEFVIPVSMLVYGYPTKQQRERKKPIRFEREYIVYENKYHRLTKAQHDEMHKIRNEKTSTINKNVAEDIKALCKRKYMSDFSLEMDRSVGEYLKKFRKRS